MTEPDSPSTARSFTLADLIILIAGFGVGIAWLRSLGEIQGGNLLTWPLPPWRSSWWVWVVVPTPLFVAFGVATLICRLQDPCPPLRDLTRLPGATAVGALALVLVWEGTIYLTGFVLEPTLDWLSPRAIGQTQYYAARLGLFTAQIVHAGSVIAVTWIIQVAAGHWRPDRSWLDRTGRFIGVCLITLNVLRSVAFAARF